MTITDEQPPDTHTFVDRPGRHNLAVGWVLALGWLTMFGYMLVFGVRETSYDRFEADLRSGDIGEVQESSELRGWRGWRGSETVTVRWRDGLVMRTATWTHASDERAAKRADDAYSPRPIVVGSVADHLTAIDPDVRVTRVERRYESATYLGWRLYSEWVGLAGLVLLGATLVLISGHRPWRATRWAWGWLVLLAPGLGVPLYFLLGGPLGLFRPHPPRRIWLTGGWAFLLALAVGGATGT